MDAGKGGQRPDFTTNRSPNKTLNPYTYAALFSAQNTQKEDVIRELLRPANPGYGIDFFVLLLDGLAEIDTLLEDQASSAVVLAELKWLRKPTSRMSFGAGEAHRKRHQSSLSGYESMAGGTLTFCCNGANSRAAWMHTSASTTSCSSETTCKNTLQLLVTDPASRSALKNPARFARGEAPLR